MTIPLFQAFPHVLLLILCVSNSSNGLRLASTQNGPDSELTGIVQGECKGRSARLKGLLQGPIFNLHVTHHAGRSTQIIARRNSRQVNWVMAFNSLRTPNETTFPKMFEHGTWNDFESHFGFAGQTYGSLDDFRCKENDIVLTTVIRHPMHRVLHYELRSESGQDGCETDNYALRWYLGLMCEGPCCGGGFTGADKCVPLSEEHLELAKQRVKRFDVILVLEHLDETNKLLCSRLGFSSCDMKTNPTSHNKVSAEQFETLRKRNALDIQLYEYMKQRAFDMLDAEGLPVPSKDQQAAAMNFSFTEDAPKHFTQISSHSSSSLRWKCR